ncbi:hypothetical protein N5915_00965 [Arcobacter lacus]|uniref:hypothetical protein n=1 Tax=Arcobacter lacus TaxID=1912876 RepID=UPI0021BB5DC0|nr:hypothetical protein [Arcobacter lacus]MCG3714140.1 hypothetical protein [Aliarcobacter butzleri]MCT7908120.1 hypothetical protein [Arcobacter lacus]
MNISFDIYFWLYYGIQITFLLIYIVSVVRLKYSLVSVSSFSLLFAMIITIPGYFIAHGVVNEVIYNKFYRGFDFELYLLYLIFLPVIVMSLLLGQVMASKIYIKFEARKNFLSKVKVVFFVLVIYSIAYLYWLPIIPLNDLVLSSTDKIVNSLARNLITHGLGSIEDLPFLFRYWRNVTNYFLPILFYYYIIYNKNEKHGSMFILIFFIFVLYMQIFTLEKAPALVFLIGITLTKYYSDMYYKLFYNQKKSIPFFKILSILFLIIILFIFFYKITMNVDGNLLKDIFLRIADQSSSNYIQIEYVREVGFLGFSGIHMPILSSLFDIKIQDPSKYAIMQLYPAFFDGEIAGSAGGMSLTNLYYIIGWYAIPTLFLFVTIFAFIDKLLVNSIFNKYNVKTFHFNISFYIIFILVFSRSVGSNIWMVFSIPTVLSANLIVILCFYFLFIKIPYKIYIKK